MTPTIEREKSPAEEKVLLLLLPFWSPLIPPMGISCLKAVLQQHGCAVKAVDINIEQEFRKLYDEYFEILREVISEDKTGNFYNIGNDVLRNHMMVYLYYADEKECERSIKIFIQKNFFCGADSPQLSRLNEILKEFYDRLRRYLLNLIEKERPTVLGISVFNGTLPASLFSFKLVKENYSYIQTVMGGGIFADDLAIGSDNFEFFLEKTPYIDKIIIGEGENLFLNFIQQRLPESKRVYTLEDIDGELVDLAHAGLPDFSDFDLQFYPNLAAYTSRGCPFRCSFCSESVRWGSYRKKKAVQIVGEMKELYQKYGYQLFLMCDSLLNPVVTELAEEFVRAESSLYWDGYLRVDRAACNRENTLMWRRGGFYRARLGVESGSQRVLAAMRKGINPDQIFSSVASLAYAGIKTTTYWVIGHPGETEEDFQCTLNLIEKLADDIYEADCNPFNYYIGGQANSNQWQVENRAVPLYQEVEKEALMMPTWILDTEPNREEIYNRVHRFVQHCRELGIPNPYSLHDIYKADERWKILHRNSVPSLVELKMKGTYLVENKNVKHIVYKEKLPFHDNNWGF
jgi:radical SAM superfamily enzyme YgiQ (UPF0313 family)